MKRLLTSLSLVVACGAGSWIASSTATTVGAAGQTAAGLITTSPVRVLNTRGSKLPAGGEVVVNTGITGATAVAVNITITDTEGTGGFVTAWTGGARPNTSIINAAGPDMTLANAAIIPVNADGTFQLYTYQPANLLVDLMGYFPGGTPIATPAGFAATITGYNPLDFGSGNGVTYVSGTVSNGTGSSRNLRVDVHCPNGSVATDSVFSVAAGQAKGFEVSCNGVFSSGATIQTVVEV